MFARVTVRCDGFPALHIRPGFGAAVVKGDVLAGCDFSVLLCTGKTLSF